MLAAMGVFIVLLLAVFLLLAISDKPVKPSRTQLIQDIEAVLPQTQCGHCGYLGCAPYAEAIVDGQTSINRCAPGGQSTVDAIAAIVNQPSTALDTAYRPPSYAFIREAECIGCTKCIQACPVDAILGASHYMHTVLQDECTGCDLCVEACPVDCIEMRPDKESESLDLIALIEGEAHV